MQTGNLGYGDNLKYVATLTDSDVDLARIGAPCGGAWLNALSSQQIGTKLHNDTFRVGVAFGA